MLSVGAIYAIYFFALAVIFYAEWRGWFAPRVVRVAGSTVFLSDGREFTVFDGKHIPVGMRVRLIR